MSSGGDWMCPACQHLNFKKRRDSCQRCSCPKYATAAEVSSYASEKAKVLPGDWYCAAVNCGTHNYASRSTCRHCGASKAYYGYGAGAMALAGFPGDSIPGWQTGDWICNRMLLSDIPSICGTHNYASRKECYKCNMPRDDQPYANCSDF